MRGGGSGRRAGARAGWWDTRGGDLAGGQEPGQGHDEGHGSGQCQRRTEVDAGGSGKDTETKQAKCCSGTQGGRTDARVRKSQRALESQKAGLLKQA